MAFISSNVVSIEVEGDGATLCLKDGQHVVLNQTGVILFNCLSRGDSQDEAVAKICEGYECAESEARADVDSFIEQIGKLGVARWREDDEEAIEEEGSSEEESLNQDASGSDIESDGSREDTAASESQSEEDAPQEEEGGTDE